MKLFVYKINPLACDRDASKREQLIVNENQKKIYLNMVLLRSLSKNKLNKTMFSNVPGWDNKA